MSESLIGSIHDQIPYIYASIRNGRLAFHQHGEFAITVDTGFSGAIMLPKPLIRRLGLRQIGTGPFILADGTQVDLPIYRGQVLIMGREEKTWFIPGDFLVGMELLSSISSSLLIDFKQRLLLLKK